MNQSTRYALTKKQAAETAHNEQKNVYINKAYGEYWLSYSQGINTIEIITPKYADDVIKYFRSNLIEP